MATFIQFGWYFAAMAALVAVSAFFSCSEAALFSLQADDRRLLKHGKTAQRSAIELLERPDRLLSAILFWNLLVNTAYYVLGVVVGVQLQTTGRGAEAGAVGVGTLLGLILGGEMIPKTLGVEQPRLIASVVSLPLAAAVRALDPMMPLFAAVNRILQRLLLPNFSPEPYLEINDLERAITLSTDDAQLAAKEQSALQNIVLLSELPAEELMRPRKQYDVFQPPVHLQDLHGRLPASGYLLVTETASDEIAGAISLKHLTTAPRQHLENFARPVVYAPWCATVATVLDDLRRQGCEVAAVINEMGETIGVVTLEDVLETIFEHDSSRSARLLSTSSIVPIGEDRWHVTGITNLRRLGRHFGVRLEPAISVTVAGVLQELLQRWPAEGDEAEWSGFGFRVVDAPEDGPMKVELRLVSGGGPLP